MRGWKPRGVALIVIASAAVIPTTLAIGPGAARASDVAIVQGGDAQAGLQGRQTLTSPGSEFTRAAAQSGDPDSVQVAAPNAALGGWGMNFTVKRRAEYPVVVTVTWTNPTTGEKRIQFVIVNSTSKRYDRTDAVTTSVDAGHNLVTLPSDNGHFLRGAEGKYGKDAVGYPHMVWFSSYGVYTYEYEYMDDAGTHHWGLFIVNVAAAAPPAAAPGPPRQPPSPSKTPDDKGGGGY